MQKVILHTKDDTFSHLDTGISIAMKQTAGFVSHVAAEKIGEHGAPPSQDRQYYQATLWRGDSFVSELSSSEKNHPRLLPRKGKPSVTSELGQITFIDEPTTLEERPGTLCIATLATNHPGTKRTRQTLSEAHESLSQRPDYGGSCLFTPTYPRGYVYLFTWVHDNDREQIAAEFIDVLEHIHIDGDLRIVSFDVAKHLSWSRND